MSWRVVVCLCIQQEGGAVVVLFHGHGLVSLIKLSLLSLYNHPSRFTGRRQAAALDLLIIRWPLRDAAQREPSHSGLAGGYCRQLSDPCQLVASGDRADKV